MTASAGTRRVPVEGELTIHAAVEHKDRLLAAVRGGAGIRLDLAGVSELDTAGLQLLLLVKREAAAHHVTVELCNLSPAVTEVLTVAHLSELGA